jgi:hypothetical protein
MVLGVDSNLLDRIFGGYRHACGRPSPVPSLRLPSCRGLQKRRLPLGEKSFNLMAVHRPGIQESLSHLDSKYQRRKGPVSGVEPDRRILRCASRRVGAFVPYIYVSHLVVGAANSYAGEPACTLHDVQWQVLDRVTGVSVEML